MKKPFIYAIILSALAVFAALTVAYRMKNPDRIIPSPKYTEYKAQLLTASYTQAAKELEIEEDKLGSTVYACMAEYPTKELETTEGVTAEFRFFDLLNKYAHVKSNGYAVNSARFATDFPSEFTKAAAELFDDTFVSAGDSDYGIPDYGTVKLYIRRGDGVYYKVYNDNNLPAGLSELIKRFEGLDTETAEENITVAE